MLAAPILHLGALPCELSCEELADNYGPKTAGVIDPLETLPEESPVPWLVLERIVLPPKSRGRVSEEDLKQIFEEIVGSCDGPRPWFARSTELKEQSGRNHSPEFYVDPNDKRGSFRDFQDTVKAMREGNPDMGVLLMPMVGEWSVLAGGAQAFGAEIVSFAADTVNPFRPSEMHMAFAHGLGMGAVGAGRDAVRVTADRESGKITFFGNLDERVMRCVAGSTARPVDSYSYRQKKRYFFDPQTKRIESKNLSLDYFITAFISRQLIDDGVLRLEQPGESFLEKLLGQTPFGNPAMLSNLVSILQFIHARKGRSQIEGAFLNRTAPYPYLYQHITPPPSPELARDIAPLERHIYSDMVIGCGSFEGPLVWYLGDEERDLRNLTSVDAAFAGSSYILLGAHTREIINSTPHCLHRISEDWLNASGHAITLMREWMQEHPERAMTIAERARVEGKNTGGCRVIAGRRGKTDFRGTVVVFDKARLDSNGREMAVEISSKRSLSYLLFGM